jgi:antitoxin FitA
MCQPGEVAKMIQVRNVPERLHRELTRRAKARGQSLTAYIEELLERDVSKPPVAEVLERIRARGPIKLGMSGAQAVRESREEHERDRERGRRRR